MKILIADDHPLFRDALRGALEDDGASIGEAADLPSLLRILSDDEDVDLVMLDLAMPGTHGLAGLVRLRAEHPEVAVLVISASDDPITMRRSIDLGAGGFVSKSESFEGIRDAVRAVLAGDVWLPENAAPEGVDDLADRLAALTPQQARVLSMLAEGLLNKQIAYELGVSEATIKAHVSAVLAKLGVDSRTQAVIRISRPGAADVPAPPVSIS